MAGRNKLSVMQCKRAGTGRMGDGAGLYLYKQSVSGGQWVYRYTNAGKRREMGLGAYPDLSLSDARALRDEWASVRAKGHDPITVRDAERRKSQAPGKTLAEVTAATFEAKKPTLRDDGDAGRWLSPLRVHVLPSMGERDVETITQADIENTLKPIWQVKPVAARKAMSRWGQVMKYAAARGLSVDLNAIPLAKALLGEQGHVEKHITAMPWQDVPDYYATLQGNVTPVTLALRLLILTVARSRPIRFAHVDQFDLESRIWTIPAEGEGARQKGRKNKVEAFRVPLNDEAMKVVTLAMERMGHDGNLFPAMRGKSVISDAAMSKRMTDAGLNARPHGFRTSFRTWCAETGVPEHLAEMHLSHAIGSKVTRAYRRTDEIESRKAILEKWEGQVLGVNDLAAEKIIRLRKT